MKVTGRIAAALVAATLVAGCGRGVDDETRFRIARDNTARGDHGAAMIELKNLLQSNPADIPALLLLGEVSSYTGLQREAEIRLQHALALGAPPEAVLVPLGHVMLGQGRFEGLLEAVDPSLVTGQAALEARLLRFEALLNLGRVAEARHTLLRARDQHGDTPAVLVALSRLAVAEDRGDAAESFVLKAIDADPFRVSAWRALGVLRFSQQRYAEAAYAFSRAIEATHVRPRSDELLLARTGLTESQWRLGERSTALANAKDLLNAYPQHPLPKYLRAVLAYDAGDYYVADKYLREVLRAVPNHPPSMRLLASTEFLRGNLGEAELQLGAILERHPDDHDMRTLLAYTHLRMGNAEQALATLAPLDPDASHSAMLLALVGKAYLRAGRFDRATDYLEQAARLDARDPGLRRSLVVALSGAGRHEQALLVRERLRTIDHESDEQRLLELAMLMHSDRPDQAADYAKSLRRLDASNLHAMLALAQLAEERGDRLRATEWLELARIRNPASAEVRLLLARYYNEAGDHPRALVIAEEAVRAHPHHADVLNLLGETQVALGRRDAAAASFREALRIAPDAPVTHYNLARLALLRGRPDEAADHLTRLLQIAPDYVDTVSRLILDSSRSGNQLAALRLARALGAGLGSEARAQALTGDIHMARGHFHQARRAYDEALATSADRMLVIKSFIAAREAGVSNPAGVLERWLARNPDDAGVRSMLDHAQSARPAKTASLRRNRDG